MHNIQSPLKLIKINKTNNFMQSLKIQHKSN